MAKSDDFTKWLSSNSVNGYTDCIQINVLKDSIYTIGFYISEKLSDEFRHAHSFKIKGKLCSKYGFTPNGCEYFADIEYNAPKQEVCILDNIVDPNYRRKGIGSLGLAYIKYISSLLHCKKILGVKQPIPNTSEEMNVLTAFYQKNGFKNLTNNKICYIFTEKE